MSRRPTTLLRSTARTRRSRPLLLLVVVAIALVSGVGYLSGERGTTGQGSTGQDSTGQDSAGQGSTGQDAAADGDIAAPPAVPASALTSAEALALLAALPDAVYTDDGSYAGNREELFGEAWAFD
ncbi:MAG: hypothetical protein ABWY68_10480, partial [Cryobacterium sp.]